MLRPGTISVLFSCSWRCREALLSSSLSPRQNCRQVTLRNSGTPASSYPAILRRCTFGYDQRDRRTRAWHRRAGNKLDPAELTAVGVLAVQHRRASGRNLTTYVRVTLRYC
jgi:hypothetical protein